MSVKIGDRFIPTINRIKKTYDRYAHNYDAASLLQRDLADKLAMVIPQLPLRILDIGCGTGYLLQEICRGGFQTRPYMFGCDISFGMLSQAKNKMPAFYVQSDASHLPFADSSFDVVISNAAYQWIPDLKFAFKEAKRALKAKGEFYFTIFNKNTLWQLQGVCKEINIASSSFPDKAKLSSALVETGFSIGSIEIFRYEKYYKDLWQLLGILKNIGCASAENNIKGLSWRAILENANDSYRARFSSNRGLPATYEAFLVKAENG